MDNIPSIEEVQTDIDGHPVEFSFSLGWAPYQDDAQTDMWYQELFQKNGENLQI